MAGILFEATAQLQLQEEVALDLVPTVKQQAIPTEKAARKRFDSLIFRGCGRSKHTNFV
jgi:hypothetical protein